jgi:hypothetical protein
MRSKASSSLRISCPLISAAPVAVAEPATDTSLYERGTAYTTIKKRNPTLLNESAADYSIVKEREAEEEKREDLHIGTNYYDKRGEEERGRICILSRTIMTRSNGLAANG